MESMLVGLEGSIKALPGVLGCVILTDGSGTRGEIQAFVQASVDREAVEALIAAETRRSGLGDSFPVVHVFELEAESVFGDRGSLERAVELAEQEARARGPILLPEDEFPDVDRQMSGRPRVQRVVLTSSSNTTEAEVALESEGQAVGLATGEKTPHGLSVVAQATINACKELVGAFDAELRGASLVSVVGVEAVLVLLRWGQTDLVGSALLRGGPASEATVRATLDALNRVLSRGG